jgi:uncharacterized membrane protein YoaK (UPF0700 family)
MFTQHVPRWIPIGGFTLACSAGVINAVGFLGVGHEAISHMSGNVTLLGNHVVFAEHAHLRRAAALIVCFFAGSLLSGLVVRQSTLKLGARYGVALALESLLLFLATYFLHHGSSFGDYLAATACGLQNAMATSYSGAVVRTTHVTGIITDIGIAIGLWARRDPVDWRRIRLYLVLLAGFTVGGLLGAVGFRLLSYDTLLIPATLTGVGGFAYAILIHGARLRSRATR